jgi:long-chain acyl-CoA synthetase
MVEGTEHLASLRGPALVCPNHTSHLDAPVVRFALPRDLRDRTAIAAAADYFFAGGLLGPIVALGTGAFPFGRVRQVRAALDRVAELLADGWLVIVFPEGTRSPTGELQPFLSGIGLLAVECAVPMVPVHIEGAHRILPKGTTLPRRRGRVRVRFGPPLEVDPKDTFEAATARIEAAVRGLAAAGSSTSGQ